MTTSQDAIISTAKDTKGFALTIYNQDFALVREQRQITFDQGTNFVRYEDVAVEIDPTSISLKSINAPDAVIVREQNYQYDLLNPGSILNKSVGKIIRFRRINPDGQVEVLEGTLLNPRLAGGYYEREKGLVIRLQDGRIILNPAGEIELNEMPEGLVSRPSLLWKLDVSEAGEHTLEVSYLANRIKWQADYIAVVNREETRVDITSWVTLDNRSGATYESPQLQLIAGDVHYRDSTKGRGGGLGFGFSGISSQFQEEAFFEYHLYTLQGSTTICNNETKQMALMSATDVQVKRKLVYDSSRQNRGQSYPGKEGDTIKGKASVVLELQNSSENNMGMPLPKGKIRLYKTDDRGNLQFLGEDALDHTPRNETAKFYIGDSFDVVGERKCTNRKQLSERVTERSLETSIRNRKNSSVEVWVVERFWGDWEMLHNSHTYNLVDAKTIEFLITVEADSEVKIIYKVREIS